MGTNRTTKKTEAKKTKVEQIFPQGLICFPPHENAPEWIKAEVIISIDKLNEWVGDNAEHLQTHKKYGEQLKLTLKEGKDGNIYFTVNNFKPEKQK